MLAILLGALVVGIGTGYFLYLANKDRQMLATEANHAKLQAQEALQTSQQAIEEANQKLKQANEQVAKAEKALQNLQNQEALLEKARPMVKPNPNKLSDWSSVLSTDMELSIMYPTGNKIITNNDKSLSIANEDKDLTWLKITKYSDKNYNKQKQALVSSTTVAYFIDGKLIAGESGLLKNTNSNISLLNIYSNGTSTHLISIMEPPPFQEYAWSRKQEFTIEDILQTLEFKK